MADRGVVIRSLYVGLFGIATVAALAGWSVTGYPNSTSTALQVSCTLAAGFIVLALDRLSKQTRGLPNVIAALAMAGTMVGIQIALGVPLSRLMLYALSGFLVGGLIGAVGELTHTLTLLMPLAALVGSVFASLQAWNSLQLTPIAMWQMVIIIAVPALALSSLAPTIDIATAGRVWVLVLLFAGMWFWPVTALAHGSSGWRISTCVWALEGVGSVLFLALMSTPAQDLLDRLWLTPHLLLRLFPFSMRQAEEDEPELHLEELVNEPDDCITASHVTAWIYKPQGQITHIVLAGHANTPVCKEISAKLFSTFLEYGDDRANEALLVPGAFLMQAPPPSGKQSVQPLDDLVQQLRQVQELTGMVQIREAGPISYDKVCAALREQIEQGIRSGKPLLLCHSNPDAPSRAVFMPFYALNGWQLAPLSFDLDYRLFRGPEFDYLLKAHRLELHHEMVADALRRKRIYEEWRERDVEDFHRLTYMLLQRILPAIAIRDLESLTESYIQILLNELPETLPIWTPGLPLQIRNLLAVGRSQRLRQFIDSNEPGVISSDAEWTRLIESVLVKEFPIQGQRNYTEATITDSGRRLAHVSLQELVEWHIPSLIRSDDEWIRRMDELLRRFDEADPKREARIDAINLGTFLDAFLRGWAPVFLPDKETKARYKSWCAERRKAVWKAIHQLLIKHGMRMDPLQVDNVVFAVRKVSKHRVKVTPYYLTSDRAFTVLLHPCFGMTCYVNTWQHRQRVATSVESAQDNRAICMAACQAGEKALAAGDSDAALVHFKQALRAHPAAAAERIFTRFWATTSRDTSSQLDDLMLLVEAVNLFPRDPDQASQKLNRFVEHYPDFLPDPYLLLGYHNHELTTEVTQIEARLHTLQNRNNELIKTLVENGVLIPEYSDGGHGERSGKFMINMRVADWEDRERLSELNRLQEEITQTSHELAEARRRVWHSLQAKPNEQLAHAMALDAEYVTHVLREAMIMASHGYAEHIAPLHGLLKGNEYLRIERGLREKIQVENGDLIDQLKDRAPSCQRATLKRLRSIVDECMKTEYLESQETSALQELRRLLDQFEQVDSITREMIIHNRIKDIGADYVRRAYHLYNEAASRVPEITEVRKQLSSCQYMMCHYRHALRTLIGGPNIPVQNGFAQAQFDVLISTPLQVGSVVLDSASKTIQVISPQGQSHSVLRFSGLSADECQHLMTEFAKPGYVSRLKSSKLTPAYGILLTPISVPPRTKLWQDVLLGLEAWLIRVLAYTGIPPMEMKLPHREEILAHFDHTPVIEQVVVDTVAVRERFLDSVDPDRKVRVQNV